LQEKIFIFIYESFVYNELKFDCSGPLLFSTTMLFIPPKVHQIYSDALI